MVPSPRAKPRSRADRSNGARAGEWSKRGPKFRRQLALAVPHSPSSPRRAAHAGRLLGQRLYGLDTSRSYFVWYAHADTDELFRLLEGEMRIAFRDGAVTLKSGDLYVVPKGKEHKPYVEHECRVLLLEPEGVRNTGDAEAGSLTALDDVWI